MKSEIKEYLKSIGSVVLIAVIFFGLVGLALVIFGCGGQVLANAKPPQNNEAMLTIIAGSTQITQEEFGDFEIQCGSLYGIPSAAGSGVKVHGNITVSCPTGFGLIQDLFVDGCITVNRTARVEITRVWVQGCAGSGISFVSDPIASPGGNQSCCAKLDHVVSFNNTGSGLLITNTADVIISNSEFEANGRYGMELIGSPTIRAANSDFGGGGSGGIYVDPGSGSNLFSNLQFGNNKGDDLTLLAPGSTLTGLSFIGPPIPGICSIRTSQPQFEAAINFGPRPRC